MGGFRSFVYVVLNGFPDIEVLVLFLSRATSLCRSSYDFINRVQELVDWEFAPPKIPQKSVSKTTSNKRC